MIVALSPFELRMRYMATTLPHYTEMGHSSFNLQGQHYWHVKVMDTNVVRVQVETYTVDTPEMITQLILLGGNTVANDGFTKNKKKIKKFF